MATISKVAVAGLATLLVLAGCSSSTTIENPSFQDDSGGASQESSQADEASKSPSASTSAEPTPSKPEQQELSVVETHFWPSEDYDRWYFVAYIENPNQDYAWIFEGFEFEAYDADGILLDSTSEYATILPNSTEVFFGYWFSIGNNIVSEMNVRGSVNGSLLDSTPGFFEVESIEYSNERFSSEISGVITSTFSEDQESVEVVAVVRDSGGAIIAADSGYVSRVPSGGKARFEITFFDFEFDDSMQIEVYPKL